MRLFEHDEFEQAMIRAAGQFGVNEQFVEKDYYVTEILRIVADRLGDKAMFKGGTSLSKGWGLISRFSEDVDLFVNPDRGAHEVRAMLASAEYAEIRQDYDAKSRQFFASIYRPPDNLSFAASPALSPDDSLRERIASESEAQCGLLFAGSYPSFNEVLARFEEIRNLL